MIVPAEFLDEFAARVAEMLAPKVAAALAARIGTHSAPERWALVGVEEAAAALGRSKRWVHGAIKERGLPYVRLDGGALGFDLDDIRVWAMERRVPALELDPLAARLHPGRNGASRQASRVRGLTVTQKARA